MLGSNNTWSYYRILASLTLVSVTSNQKRMSVVKMWVHCPSLGSVGSRQLLVYDSFMICFSFKELPCPRSCPAQGSPNLVTKQSGSRKAKPFWPNTGTLTVNTHSKSSCPVNRHVMSPLLSFSCMQCRLPPSPSIFRY